jgi:hypothetical protein
MLQRTLVASLCVLLATAPVALQSAGAQAPPGDAELEKGIQQAREGDSEAAVLTLDGVSRRLAGQPAQSRALARAYTYLAVAYLGLAQEQQARAKFAEALDTDSSLSVTSREFPPRVLELFEAVRQERAAPAGPAPAATKTAPAVASAAAPGAAAPAAVTTPPSNKGGGSKALWIGLGAAAVGGGVALAIAGGGGGDSSPAPAAPSTVPATPTAATYTVAAAGGSTQWFAIDDELEVRVGGALVATVRCNVEAGSCRSPSGYASFSAVPGTSYAIVARNLWRDCLMSGIWLFRNGVIQFQLSSGIPEQRCPEGTFWQASGTLP